MVKNDPSGTIQAVVKSDPGGSIKIVVESDLSGAIQAVIKSDPSGTPLSAWALDLQWGLKEQPRMRSKRINQK